MTHFLKLKEQSVNIIDDVLDAERKAEERREIEMRAVIRIQCLLRGIKARRRARTKYFAILEIQRFARGWLARRNLHDIIAKKQQEKLLSLFHASAVKFQKVWRGFKSRKYIHNYYARKHYLAAIQRANEEAVMQMEQYRIDQEQRIQVRVSSAGVDDITRAVLIQEAEERQRADIENLADRLHYLVGTRTQPGVFKHAALPPAAAAALGAGDGMLTVEEHLRMTTKKIPVSEAKARAAAGAAMPIKERGTIRASGPYQAALEESRFEKRMTRGLFAGHGNFKTHLRPRSTNEVVVEGARQSVHINTTYVPFRPLMRTDRKERQVSAEPFILGTRKFATFDEVAEQPARTSTTRAR